MQPWLIYALGGGLGHFQRAAALARRAAARGWPVTVLTNARAVTRISPEERECWLRGVEIHWLDPDRPKEETAWAVGELVRSRPWRVFVADTFPRGLAGELAEIVPNLQALRVWVHRDLTPDYVVWAGLREFAAHYELVLVPGEDALLADLPQAVRTEPWLLCDEAELLSRAAARSALGVPDGDDRPVVLVSAAGMPEEQPLFIAAAEQLAVRLPAAHVLLVGATSSRVASLWHWPLAELLRGVDLLVGAGGYHTVHEARAAEVPLVALAQERLYDRQALRLIHDERARNLADLVARACERLNERAARLSSVWPRGAEQAVAEIEGSLRRN